MAKQIIVKNIVIGNPICDPWYMFCNEPDEWDTTKKRHMVYRRPLFTEINGKLRTR